MLHMCFTIQGGKFDFGSLVLKIGSGIALLAIVSKLAIHLYFYM